MQMTAWTSDELDKIDAADELEIASLRAGGVEKDVTFMDADHDLDDKVDSAYRAKYQRYAGRILNSVLTAGARSTTMNLVPRPTRS